MMVARGVGSRVECRAESTLQIGHGTPAAIKVFCTADGTVEVVTLVHGEARAGEIPLVRLHSACLTGDVLGSLKCDCGDQLRIALGAITAAPWGMLLYLTTHEGRGIGLANKIRAYALQEGGLDTVAANEALGLPSDARDFGAAAEVLKGLGATRVRLMTNNPQKTAALESHGIRVTEQVPITVGSTPFNREYLEAKRVLLGHQLPAAS